MKPQELTLDCEAMSAFRESLNLMIRKTVDNLVARDLAVGTVTAKVKISLEKHADQYGQDCYLLKIEPETSTKIGASGKVKCKTKNGIFLKYAGDGTPVIGERQMEVDEFIRGKAEESAWSA